ncbi:hypothetical protein DE146DRAFT_402431 [Phaeosphaeria sp. MPI-PUGE-AT-0046c]|nr:hypothetical protein DE146DRAFT_402431 [Phaeosphaeria sp. MPI-PUGE-AT-0046c]
MSTSTDKQIILVTGSTNGIGLDTAIFLARDSPNNHVIMGARNSTKAEARLKEVRAKVPNGTFSYVQLDQDDDASIAAAAKQIEQDFGRLDVLVNNAGICPEGGSLWTSRKHLRETFETNVYGPMILTEALIPLLKLSQNPMVINVSSGLGSIAALGPNVDPNTELWHYKDVKGPGYRMSKAALNMLTAYQYAQLRESGFKIWSYCPGWVVTDLTNDREQREKIPMCDSSETSAQGILDIVHGKRDAEVGNFVGRQGRSLPW